MSTQMSNTQTMLTLDHLHVTVGGKRVCRDVNLRIETGQRWAILGVNGVGKTTLLHTLAGLREAQSGQVSAGDTAIQQMPARVRAQRVGLMSQDDDFAVETSVLDAVLLGRLPHLVWWRGEREEDVAIARAALRRVGLAQTFETRLCSTLSGGERRRVALATLLAQDVPLLILDEPTTHLDLHQQIALLDLLTGLSQHTMLMSLHDVNLAARYCTHALLLFGEGEYSAGPLDALFDADSLTRLYGHRILVVPGPTSHTGLRNKLFIPA
jgi:iron complex transport system ATP-binding protein